MVMAFGTAPLAPDLILVVDIIPRGPDLQLTMNTMSRYSNGLDYRRHNLMKEEPEAIYLIAVYCY